MSDQPQPPQDPEEFAAVLMQHAKGRAHDEATRALKEAVEATLRTGKKSTVAVTLEIHPVKNADDVIRLEDKVKATLPLEPRASMWFADEEGTLHRDNPTQIPMWGGANDADRTHEASRTRED